MGRSQEFNIGSSPLPMVQAGAAAYTRQAGLAIPEPNYRAVAMPHRLSRAVGREYMNMPEHDPEALPAFHAMAEEVGRQFDHMTKPRSKGGMGLSVTSSAADPYGGAGPGNDYSTWSADRVIPELRHDVVENNHIGVLSTASTGGHPVFSNDRNDMFRAVHDVFGHLGSGRGIDKHGEEAATQKHATMFSDLARRAMLTETRGQNSALHLTGEFQDQKVGLLSARHQTLSPHQFGEAIAREASFENRKQGIDPGDY